MSGLVKQIRATRGLTQEGLARELGVSFATVNGWENGRHGPIPALARRASRDSPPPRAQATPLRRKTRLPRSRRWRRCPCRRA